MFFWAYSITHLVKEAQGRYSPAAVVAVSREVVSGDPEQYVSTSYVERQNLSLRMGQRRFTRLTNGFSKKLDNHVAAVALYVARYNLCRVHEALKATPAKALGVVERTWARGAYRRCVRYAANCARAYCAGAAEGFPCN